MCLQHLTSLERLALESNLIGNLGLEAMTRALVHNVSLTEIFLYNNDLDDDTMRVAFEVQRSASVGGDRDSTVQDPAQALSTRNEGSCWTFD